MADVVYILKAIIEKELYVGGCVSGWSPHE